MRSNLFQPCGRMSGCFFFLFLAALLSVVQAAHSQMIPAQRTPIWQGTVGVPGGIPNRTTIYTTIPAGAAESTIQSALNSCPSNQVVMLSAGTYTFTTSLNVPSYVTLRGAGINATIINVSSVNYVIQAYASFNDDFGAPVTANHVSWTGNYTQNTNTLVLSASNLAGGAEAVPVGNLVMIDQQSDANCNASGGYGLQGVWWSIANPTTGADRYQHEISYVTAKSGHTITIDPPIRYANYNSSASPQVWFEVGTPVKFAGIENLSVHNTGGNNSTHGIGLQYAYGCWILNCGESNFRYGLSAYFAVRSEIRHCTLSGLSGSGDDYEFSLYYTGGCLFEDNIVYNYNNPFLLESCIGDAFAYNYTTNGNSGTGGNMNSGDFASHGGNNAMNLLEGNNFMQVSLDNGWGSAFGFVLLRNRITGWDESGGNYGNYVAAIDDYSMNRSMTVVGNVLGTTGKNTVYEAHGTSYNLVFLTQLSISGVAPSPDPVVSSTLIRAMNWDSANGTVVSGGYTSADLPASLLYSSKPSYFGNLAWPPVDPTNPVYSSSYTNIPAAYRFNLGKDPSTTSVNQPPVAKASATPTSGTIPLTVAFSSSGSSDPEGAPLTYSWNFGDGTSSTSPNPSHIYSTVGNYSAVLTVSDGTNIATASAISIAATASVNLPPTVSASATLTSGLIPLTVVFSSAGSVDPEGAPLTYSWNFGDGTSSTSANPSHIYSTAGNFSAKLTVSDGTNSVTSSSIAITATAPVNLPPTASAGASPTSGFTPLNVTFSSAGSVDPEGAPLTYSWNFGDGTSSTSANPSHIYSTAGSFSAKLTVSDGTNSVTSSSITITATAPVNQPPVAVAGANPTSGSAPLAVAFTSTGSADPEGAALTYNWVFGDGNTSTAANPSHTYANAGNYTVQLSVSDGTNTTTVSNITINVTGLVAAFGFEEASTTTVVDSATGLSDGTIANATHVPGKYGEGVAFNGVNSVISVNSAMASTISSNMTIEAWVDPATAGNVWKPIIGKSYKGTQLSYVVQGVTPMNGAPSLYLAPAANNLVGSSPLPTNTWSHVAATYDGTTVRLYVNGVLVASQAQTGSPTPSTDALQIGSDGMLGAFWNGTIDEVRIYNKALTASAIQTDMNTPVVSSVVVPLTPPSNLQPVSAQ